MSTSYIEVNIQRIADAVERIATALESRPTANYGQPFIVTGAAGGAVAGVAGGAAAGVAGGVGGSAVATEVTPPAKRGRPRKTAAPVAPVEETKAEVLAAAAVEAEVAQVTETATRVASSFLDEDTASDEPSKDDVRSVLIHVQKKFSKDRAFALLQEFKAPSLNQLDLADYGALIAAGKKLLG